MYLTQLGTRIWRVYPLQKLVFGASESLLSFLGIGKNNFSSTLNAKILQTVRIECVRFGGHTHSQIRYKILQLEVL
jgi:hypothetical protein